MCCARYLIILKILWGCHIKYNMRNFLIGFIIIVFAIAFIASSYFLGVYRKEKRLMKYIPAGTAAVLALFAFIKALHFPKGLDDLFYLPFGIIMLIIFAISITVAIIMELVNIKKYK